MARRWPRCKELRLRHPQAKRARTLTGSLGAGDDPASNPPVAGNHCGSRGTVCNNAGSNTHTRTDGIPGSRRQFAQRRDRNPGLGCGTAGTSKHSTVAAQLSAQGNLDWPSPKCRHTPAARNTPGNNIRSTQNNRESAPLGPYHMCGTTGGAPPG
jgi:hypothetical protein